MTFLKESEIRVEMYNTKKKEVQCIFSPQSERLAFSLGDKTEVKQVDCGTGLEAVFSGLSRSTTVQREQHLSAH